MSSQLSKAPPQTPARTPRATPVTEEIKPVPAKLAPAPRRSRQPKALSPEVAATQAELAKVLEAAQSATADQPLGQPDKPKASKGGRQPVVDKKAPKMKRQKRIRDSFAMPENEYKQIAVLKKRVAGVKKSELLRAGITLLTSLNDAQLAQALAKVPRIKTGRPRKH